MLTAQGNYSEAEREISLARSCDPLSLPVDSDIGFELYYAGRYDEAIRHLNGVLAIAPNFAPAYLWLGRSYEQRGQYRESVAALEKANSLVPDWSVAIAALGHVQAISGDLAGSNQQMQHLQRIAKTRFVTPYAFALLHAGSNQRAEAMLWLNRAYNERSHWLVWLRTDPRFNNLHNLPEFRDLLSKIQSTP